MHLKVREVLLSLPAIIFQMNEEKSLWSRHGLLELGPRGLPVKQRYQDKLKLQKEKRKGKGTPRKRKERKGRENKQEAIRKERQHTQ